MNIRVGDIVKYNNNLGKVVKITDGFISTDWSYGNDIKRQSLSGVCRDSYAFEKSLSVVKRGNVWTGAKR